MLFDHFRVLIVGNLGQSDTRVRFFDVHAWSREGHYGHVDAEVVHVTKSDVNVPMRAFYDVVVARIVDQHAIAIIVRNGRVIAMLFDCLEVGGRIKVRVDVDSHASPFFLTEFAVRRLPFRAGATVTDTVQFWKREIAGGFHQCSEIIRTL